MEKKKYSKQKIKTGVLHKIGGRQRLEEAKDGILGGAALSYKEPGTRSRLGLYWRVENLTVSHCSYYLCMYETCTAAESQFWFCFCR